MTCMERLRKPDIEQRPAVHAGVASAIRAAAESVHAPTRLRAPIAEERRALWWRAARVLGALATLAVGAVHLEQYFKLYSGVPTIGTLFVLNFACATAIGLALLVPVERLAGRHGRVAVTLLALAGVGLSVTSFVFLAISERTSLFGFREPGYDPAAITAARISEIAAVALLGTFLVARITRHRRST